MRNAVIVICLCLVAGVVLALVGVERYKESVANVEDVFTGLTYFLEDHQGRFPVSEAEFRQCAFLETLSSGAIRIRPRPESRFRKHTYARPIRKLADFEIRWGVDLSMLRWNAAEELAEDEKGSEVLVIGPVSTIPARRAFTHDLMRIVKQIRSESLPATAVPAVGDAP